MSASASTSPDSSPSAAPSTIPRLTLTSPAFKSGDPIPVAYTCKGDDVSPPLTFGGVPSGTAAFALVVRDPDANGWVHWVAVDIPGDPRSLPAGVSGTPAGVQGRNGWGGTGYRGPCPPSGTHRYLFTLYALSQPLRLGAAPTADQVEAAARSATIQTATLMGTFSH